MNKDAQSRLESAIEASANIGSGFFISLAMWAWVVKPLYDANIIHNAIAITLIFTVSSWLRSYAWRRLFAVDWHKRAALWILGHQFIRRFFNGTLR